MIFTKLSKISQSAKYFTKKHLSEYYSSTSKNNQGCCMAVQFMSSARGLLMSRMGINVEDGYKGRV